MKTTLNKREDGIRAADSAIESLRFNRRVIRYEVDDSTPVNLMEKIESQDPDLAIIRIPTHRLDVLNELFRTFENVYLRDCIVTYMADLVEIGRSTDIVDTGLRIVKASQQHSADLDRIVRDSFYGYKNHYSHNPNLEEFDLIPAYQEWAQSCLLERNKTCFLFFSSDVLCGFFAAQTTGPVYRGLLSGVTPNYREKGVFREIIRAIKLAFLADRAFRLVTSVLLENRAVHKVLLDEGFTSTNSFFTVHVNLRVSYKNPTNAISLCN